MVESYFGLQREPFSVAPDPAFLFQSDQHRQALSLLDYGLHRGGGFVLLTGEIGAGKTTVWRHFLERLPADIDVASVVNPKLGVQALLARIAEDMGMEPAALHGQGDPIDMLHGHLLLANARGRRTLIVVDEAQALSDEVFEQLRLLTNLVTGDRKLVQVLLIGQPELRTLLDRPLLEPLAQRVVARFHLTPLTVDETRRYVEHRLKVAGHAAGDLFDEAAVQLVHRRCRGVPRRINVLCDRALVVARLVQRRRVDAAVVDRAARDVFGAPAPQPPPEAEPLVPGRTTVSVEAPNGHARSAEAATLPPVAPPSPIPPMRPAPPPVEAVTAGAAGAVAPSAAPPLAGTPAWAVAGVAGGALAVGVVLTFIAAQSGLPGRLDFRSGAGTPVAPVSTPVPAPPEKPTGPGSQAAAAAARQPAAQALPVPVGGAVVLPRAEPDAAAMLDVVFASAGDDNEGWQALVRLWGSPVPPGDACLAVQAQGLACFRGRGGLAPIRQLARPVLLPLSDERGRSALVLLQGLDEQGAQLRAGRAELRLGLASLARVWRGEFVTLWRAPPGARTAEGIKPGAVSRSWLLEQLDRVEGGGQPGDRLDARIAAFQLTQGLQPDGAIGPLTLMHLNRAAGIDEPRLALQGAR
jgi:general secretion pathway protein A